MSDERRGIQQVRTMGGLVDGRRTRTSAGALLELSMLETEKTRLMQEIARAERRNKDIRRRLAEIESKQLRLQRFVEKPQGEEKGDEAALALPVHTVPQERLKKRRLRY